MTPLTRRPHARLNRGWPQQCIGTAEGLDTRPRSTLRPLLASSVLKTHSSQSSTIAMPITHHVPLYRSSDHISSDTCLPTSVQSTTSDACWHLIFLSDQIPYPAEALDIVTELNPFLEPSHQRTSLGGYGSEVEALGDIGNISNSGLGDAHRSIESFAESIQRKMKDTSDMRTPKPLHHCRTSTDGRTAVDRHSSDSARDKFAAKLTRTRNHSRQATERGQNWAGRRPGGPL